MRAVAQLNGCPTKSQIYRTAGKTRGMVMSNPKNSKTLRMIIKHEWAVDSIRSLGSGYVSFLAFENSEIAPDVLDDIHGRIIGEGTWAEILHLKRNSIRRVALVELNQINEFTSFYRFDFKILNVIPFLRDGIEAYQSDYKCFYKENPG
jgi:hypothetical protein